MGVQVGILGASGFTGGELLRYLSGHPAMEIAVVAAGSRAGEPLEAAQPHLLELAGTPLVTLAEATSFEVDVWFSGLPGGELTQHVERLGAPLVIDLADDHRADPGWIYGLTEFARSSIAGAARIANPGCYPTASLLALSPLLKAGVIENPFVIDAMSGVSGAGRKAEDRLLFSSADGNFSAYGKITHRHVPEIERGLKSFSGQDVVVSFTPHLVPTTRGVLVTARARSRNGLTSADALELLNDAYANEPFVHVIGDWPSTKPVLGTNRALVSARVDERTGWVVCSAAIDNLGKGAAGQAVQNANVALGIEETTGLVGVGLWP